MNLYNLITFIIVVICHSVSSAKILGLFPHVGRSHHLVFEPLLTALAEKGHEVTVVSFFPNKDPPENYTHVSLETFGAVRKEAIRLDLFENPNVMVNMFGLEAIYRQILAFQSLTFMALNSCSKMVNFKPLKEVLRKKYDVILVEQFNSDCLLGLLHVYGVEAPVVSVLSTPLLPWSSSRIGVVNNPSYVPSIFSGYSTKMNILQRLENTLMDVYSKLWFRFSIQIRERVMIEQCVKKKIPDLEELGKKTGLMLVNTFHSLNGVRPLLPGVVEVGGMHLHGNRRHQQSIPDDTAYLQHLQYFETTKSFKHHTKVWSTTNKCHVEEGTESSVGWSDRN